MKILCRVFFAVSIIYFPSSLGLRAADASTPPSEWIDPATGHVIVRLSKEAGTASPYFHNNPYTPDGKKLVVVTPEGLSTVNLQTHAIDLVVPGYTLPMSQSSAIEVSRKTNTVYYVSRQSGQILATNLDNHETRVVATPPSNELNFGGLNADETMLVGAVTMADPSPVPPAATTPTETPTSPRAETPTNIRPGTPTNPTPGTPRGSGAPTSPRDQTPTNRGPGTPSTPFAETPTNPGPGTPAVRFAATPTNLGPGTPTSPQPETPTATAPGTPASPGARGRRGGGNNASLPPPQQHFFSVNIKTGEIKTFANPAPADSPGAYSLNHVQSSPTDPNLFLYAHEGTWSAVDRIWTLRNDGTGSKLMHVRTMPNEIAGHEFFGHDGKWVYYDLQTPQSSEFWLAGVNVETGERIRYPLLRSEWSVHYNVSWDGKVFSGDGGGPDSVANRNPGSNTPLNPPQNGQWMYLFTPTGETTTIKVNGEDVKVGKFTTEKLADLSKHDYGTGQPTRVEPNGTFTPDDKWIVFRSNMEGALHVYEVEIAKATPDEKKRIDAEWAAYYTAGGTLQEPK